MTKTKNKKPTSFSAKCHYLASFVFLAVGFLFFAGQASASSISIDFEDYELTGLNGQFNWTAGDNCFITDIEKYSGTKSLLMEGDCYLAYLPVIYPETGSLSFYTKKVILSDQLVSLGSGYILSQRSGETEIGLEPEDYFFDTFSIGINNLEWNYFVFEWRPEGQDDYLVRAFKNGQLVNDWINSSGLFFTNEFLLINNGGNYLIDDIIITDTSLSIDDTGQLFNFPAGFIASSSQNASSLIAGLSPMFAFLIGVSIGMILIEWIIGIVERRESESRKIKRK